MQKKKPTGIGNYNYNHELCDLLEAFVVCRVFFRPTALMCFPLCFELKILAAEVAISLQSSSRASSTSHHSRDLMQFHHTNAIQKT